MKNNDDKLYRWYIATTYSGREDTVVHDLQAKIKALNLDDDVKTIRTFKVKNITEKVYDAASAPATKRNSKNIRWEQGNKPGTWKKIETRIVNKFPGYIFIEMILNDKVWLAIRNSFYITGFVGSSGKGAKPIPISDEELNNMLADDVLDLEENKTEQNTAEQKNQEPSENEVHEEYNIPFSIGDKVKLLGGEWRDQEGTIKKIDLDNGMISVEVNLLGSLHLLDVFYKDLELLGEEF